MRNAEVGPISCARIAAGSCGDVGVWGVGAFSDHERFTTPEIAAVERAGGMLRWSNWVAARVRWSVEGGIEEWNEPGTVGRARSDIRILSGGQRVDLRGGAEFWEGDATFSRGDIAVTALSSRERAGRVYLARLGAGWGSSALPVSLWFGGDTGATRPTLLRAHPIVDEGRLVTEQLGREIVNATIEAQQWRRIGVFSVGAAVFVDAARTGRRADDTARSDIDAGGGLRLAFPGIPGVLRVDVATAIGDGGARWSFVYEPGG